jgi:hypothetical protein
MSQGRFIISIPANDFMYDNLNFDQSQYTPERSSFVLTLINIHSLNVTIFTADIMKSEVKINVLRSRTVSAVS